MIADKLTLPQELSEKLRAAGLRPTRQRMDLAHLLFTGGDRHVCAEELHKEAQAAQLRVSIATVYNTLNQFTEAGLLREVAIEGDRSFFDTNISNHFHFYSESDGLLFDMGTENLTIHGMPELPPDMEVSRIDVIVRLQKKTKEF